MTIDRNGAGAFVYNKNSSTGRLTLRQTITVVGDNSEAYAGVLTDNHAWFGYGKRNGILYNYTFDGNNFNLANQISQNDTDIWSMSLTKDMQHLAVAAYSYVNVFKVSVVGSSLGFSLYSKINFTHDNFKNVKLMDDFSHLLVANG